MNRRRFLQHAASGVPLAVAAVRGVSLRAQDAGQTVVVTGTVDGDLIAAAQQVIVDGTINGNVRAAGAVVTVNGEVTRNVTSLLVILQDWGLLKYHVVDDPKYRGNAFVLQTPHNTPVLRDKADGSRWVVDLWTVGYAQKPEVMTVEQWMPLD